jgi:hypothetical protein
LRNWVVTFVVAVVAAGCRTAPEPSPERTAAEPPPERSAPEPAREPAPAVVRLELKESAWTLEELFDQIHRATGISILYDASNATFTQATVILCGAHTIARDELFDWLQAVLSYRNLVLVPVGPAHGERSPRWLLIERRPIVGRTRYVQVQASDIGKYSDRRDPCVVTTITLSPTSDKTRIRNAISAVLTTTDGLGRIQAVPGSHELIVGDFAPVVAQAVRLAAVLDREFTVTTSSPDADPR